MTTSENQKLVRDYIDAVNKDDPGRIEKLFADDVQWSSPAGKRSGSRETRIYMNKWFTAFPDLKLEQCNVISDANQAAVVCKLTGTHEGDLITDIGEFAPTHNRLDMDIVSLFKFEDGKIAQIQVLYDTAVISEQLGFQAENRAA